MSILGKYTLEEENYTGEHNYVTPAVVRRDDEPISLKNSCLISVILHPTVLGISWLVSVILLYLGIIHPLFDRPAPKVKDIEFVLTEREETPINKNTPYRSDMNSRAGGKHDPNRKVSMPSPPPGTQQAVSQPAQKAAPKTVEKKTEQPKQQVQKSQPVQKPAAQQAPQQAKPQPPTSKPSIKPPMTPKVTSKPTSPFKVPVPSGGTTSGQYSTGPISGSGTSANGSASSSGTKGTGGGSFAPSPILAPTGGSSGGSKLAKGGGGGTGGGNPGPGNPNGRPGIDAIREPDFGPYMRELQRRIKMNWDPPKGDESKRVVLLFKIAKDGRLLSCSTYKSSGLPSADKAALHAVQVSAPFKPLPPDFKGSSIDIQFTFDYNVFGASGYN